ncbi:hypothetical protein QO009_003076 [Brevibacillus aydinogluensis]|jgi:hypothetical protein|uniref:hypothetical protein n=1 Tax=Brevibacillus aydinogluensis TaxID=927786 RepID=UPI002892AB48|nr:hypothetical protein [Brevibacillus aydinogluensis]MDT3417181.1 hypothetical protein [Brevibacillus aydinogluensis]
MKTKVMLFVLSLCIFFAGNAYAEQLTPRENPAAIEVNNNTKVDLNIKPMTEKEVKNGLSKMQTDLYERGKIFAIPIAMAGVAIGIVLLVIGTIFSKKIALTGLGAIGSSFLVLLILGDLNHTVQFLKEVADLVRSWVQ